MKQQVLYPAWASLLLCSLWSSLLLCSLWSCGPLGAITLNGQAEMQSPTTAGDAYNLSLCSCGWQTWGHDFVSNHPTVILRQWLYLLPPTHSQQCSFCT